MHLMHTNLPNDREHATAEMRTSYGQNRGMRRDGEALLLDGGTSSIGLSYGQKHGEAVERPRLTAMHGVALNDAVIRSNDPGARGVAMGFGGPAQTGSGYGGQPEEGERRGAVNRERRCTRTGDAARPQRGDTVVHPALRDGG